MRLPPSLYRTLMAWSLGALFAVWATFMAFGYRTGIREADELTDGHLASVASLLLAQKVTEFKSAPRAAALARLSDLKAHDYQQSMSVFIWDAQGKLLAATGEAPVPPFSTSEGFETLKLGATPTAWRAFSRWDGPPHERRVAVLLSIAERDELAEDIADNVATPGIWLLPVVALVLGIVMHRGLRPLSDLSHQVHVLDIHGDAKLVAPPHEEFRDIVHSINTLMQRYNAALARERQLASEIAHELRTPLASLVLNATALRNGLSEAERAQVADRLATDATRAGEVMADLLSLARASRIELAEARQPVDLAALAREVVGASAQAALETRHEIALDAPEACPAHGHPVLLQVALRNLVENAIHHTPAGTQIEVRVCAKPLSIEVRDNGASLDSAPSGAAEADARMGLGHQVVRRIAAAHDGWFAPGELSGGWRIYRLYLGERPDEA